VQGDPPAHRVAGQRVGLALAEILDAGVDRGRAGVAERAVAAQVGREHRRVASGVESPPDGVPALSGRGEAMEQQEAHSQHILMGALVDELARCGVRHACTSPGSRSTPLVVPLVRDGRLRCWSHVDERSGAFFALGLAKATGQAVVLACTSGTAAANYAPAVHEAREAGVPLIVLTADRPPELRDVGAGQVIDQLELYGSAAKWFVEVGNHEATPGPGAVDAHAGLPGGVDRARRAPRRRAPQRAACATRSCPPSSCPSPTRPGVPTTAPGCACPRRPRRPARAAWTSPRSCAIAGAASSSSGRHELMTPVGAAAERFAQRIGWPVLADPLGGGRCGAAAIAHYDLILRDPAFAGRAAPRRRASAIGDLPTSKAPAQRGWPASTTSPRSPFEPPACWH
jgi:2-succinyl-5-enolpyruvyl-6-hydroxy-3-cyclohexene-1-carboxylate synthase